VINNEALWFRDAFAGVVVADVSANAESSFMRASISAIRTQATGDQDECTRVELPT
jgi:hypothetical protein